MPTSVRLTYTPPPDGGRSPVVLASEPGTARERRFPFNETLEVGRLEAGRADAPGLLLVDDPTVSFRHCVLTRQPGDRVTLRDLSRNGTRLDGRRLVPNVETEVAPGQVIEIAAGLSFVLLGGESWNAVLAAEPGRTASMPGLTIASVLVGDIRDYTPMVARAPSLELQRSVGRLFERLASEVERCGGTVKEYQGDAIFAFWEGTTDGRQAASACAAALALDALATRVAANPDVWDVPGFALGMDWAIATGLVAIDSVSRMNERAGLSLVGEAVVRAFRLEKFATAETGPILVCDATRAMAADRFIFRSLGEMAPKGFDRAERVFALLGPASP